MRTIKKIKGIPVLLVMIMTALFSELPAITFSQSAGKDYSTIYFYRLKQGLMSGANSVEVKIMMNDKEIGSLTNGTRLTYKFYSEGSIKIKCVGVFGSGVIGQPYVTTIDFKHGEEYHIGLQAFSMTGVKGEILDEKQKNKMNKEVWADQTNREEDKSDPIIKK
jgi:hypothetical protein